MPLWHAWEEIYCHIDRTKSAERARAFYDLHRAEMDEGAVLLWPEQEDLYTLMCMRAESGTTAFEREKQSTPVNPELCEWPESYFGDSIWFDDWPAELQLRTLALDPSKGNDARRGDYQGSDRIGDSRQTGTSLGHLRIQLVTRLRLQSLDGTACLILHLYSHVARLRFELINRLAGVLLRLIQRRADRLAGMAQVSAFLGRAPGLLLPAGETHWAWSTFPFVLARTATLV